MMQKKCLAVPAVIAALALTGCEPDDGGDRGGQSVLRFEQYCKKEGLSASLRQTFILIDAKALKRANLATEFAERNGFIRDLALAFANPKLALASGLSDPRERISVLLVPADGSPAQLVFSGCMPGLSADEEAAARQGSSSMSEFFTGDSLKQLDEDARQFQLALIGGLTTAAKSGVEKPEPQTGAIAATPLFSAIRASRGALEVPKGMLARYVIVTDLSGATFESADSQDAPRKQGQDAGFKAGGDFGLSDVMIVQPAGVTPKGKDYLEGFLLAQGGLLASYSSGNPTAGARAPKSIRYFEGEAAYPSRTQRVNLRIADDGRGNLTSSWLTLLGGTNQPIPLTGRISCSAPSTCSIVSDDRGFAQVWTAQPGGEPEFGNYVPFGGMRNFSFEIQGVELKGAVSDPMVQLQNDGDSISVKAKATSR